MWGISPLPDSRYCECLSPPLMRTHPSQVPFQLQLTLSGPCPPSKLARYPSAGYFSLTPDSGFRGGDSWGKGCRQSQARKLTYFSLSPNHLDIKSEDDTEKKVELLASVATALAR